MSDPPSSVARAEAETTAGASLKMVAVKAAYVVAIGVMVASMVGIWQDVLTGTSATSGRPGTDYGVFHSTALLVVEGNGSAMYDPTVLGPRIAEVTGNTGITSQGYRHPPVFSLYFLPLTALPFAYAYVTFLAGGAVFLAWAISRVGLRSAWGAVGLVFISIPGFWTVQLGQMGFWVSALMVAIFLSLRAGHRFRAGLLLGLMVFKPMYAIGIGVWWLIESKRYAAAIAGVVSSAAVLVALGFAIPGAWGGYLALLGESGGGMIELSATSGFSILEMWMLLIPESSVAVWLWLACTAAVVVAFLLLLRRIEHKLEPSFAFAVVVGLLISPRTGWYDWMLLVVPGVLFWHSYPRLRTELATVGAWLFAAGALSWLVATTVNDATGVFFQFAPLVLAGVVAWWGRELLAQPRSLERELSEAH